jgi:primosomal protein N' (replication factor Y)
VPDALAASVTVGTIVRVRLHGRRVRGWVVADHVESELAPEKLQPLLTVSSAGPPAAVVTLCQSVAFRCAGPVGAPLRSASPPNNVAPDSIAAGPSPLRLPALDEPASDVDRAADELAARDAVVLRWPPLYDRRRLVAQLLASEGSTIVVTADGTRAAAFQDWLAARGTRAVLLHSDAAAAARTNAWRTAAAGSCVVVGGRSAALAPVPDLAAVVLLDDGDEALQEERSPTWNARDVLFERAASAGARTYVVSPAPTAVTVHRAASEAAPARAVEADGWPRVDVVDRRDEPPGLGHLGDRLVAAVQSAANGGHPSVLVLNRRGGVRLLRCATCHELTRWDAHGRLMVADDRVADAVAPIGQRPGFCAHCGGTRLVELRGGVQRLAAALSARVPGVEVAVVDAGVARVPADAAVVVGTEAVLHRDEVRRRRPSLVAFVDFDAELHAPRYRAAEQALWLVVRAAHMLVGADRSASRVLLQTHDPEHVVVWAALHGDPHLVTAEELERRAAFGLPPFAALAEVRGNAEALAAAADRLAAIERPGTGISIDLTEQRLVVRAPEADVLARALAAAAEAARPHGGVRVTADPPRI